MQRKAALAILLLLTSWPVTADSLYGLPTVAPCRNLVCFEIGGLHLRVPRNHVEVIDRHPMQDRLVAVRLRVPLEAFLATTRDIPVTLRSNRRVEHVSIVLSTDARSFDERLKESLGRGAFRFHLAPEPSDVADAVMFERAISPQNPSVSQLFVPKNGPPETFYSCSKRRDLAERKLEWAEGDPICLANAHIKPPPGERLRMRLQYSIYRSLLPQRTDWDKKIRSYLNQIQAAASPHT